MLSSRRISLALGAACLSLSVSASPALASAPATVTVRVEGLTETLIPPTRVTTTTTPVIKDGKPEDSCPGTSAAGALELATAGNWGGIWFGGGVKEGQFVGLGYTVETIAGENYPFSGNSFWDLWINDKAEEEHGVCGAEMQAGDQVLLFPCDFEEGPCPNPLGIEAPASANVGEPVTVAIKKYGTEGKASEIAGATVAYEAANATTNSGGHATLTFSHAGEATVRATALESVRTETTICVHAGDDGTCGTPDPSGSAESGVSNAGSGASGGSGGSGGVAGVKEAANPPYKGPYALVPSVTGLIDGHVYGRRDAPRLLAGTILAHSAVSSVSMELRREYRGRCYAYEGTRERFLFARCGEGSFFAVSSDGVFSYLLPSALAPGRYVLDIQATDVAGNHTALARGTSRIVFYVR